LHAVFIKTISGYTMALLDVVSGDQLWHSRCYAC